MTGIHFCEGDLPSILLLSVRLEKRLNTFETFNGTFCQCLSRHYQRHHTLVLPVEPWEVLARIVVQTAQAYLQSAISPAAPQRKYFLSRIASHHITSHLLVLACLLHHIFDSFLQYPPYHSPQPFKLKSKRDTHFCSAHACILYPNSTQCPTQFVQHGAASKPHHHPGSHTHSA